MGNHSLNEFSTFVNQQLDPIELINEHLAKAIALIKVAAHPNLEDCSEQTIQNYLWVLGEHIEKAHSYNTCVLDAFLFIAAKKSNVSHNNSLSEKEEKV